MPRRRLGDEIEIEIGVSEAGEKRGEGGRLRVVEREKEEQKKVKVEEKKEGKQEEEVEEEEEEAIAKDGPEDLLE